MKSIVARFFLIVTLIVSISVIGHNLYALQKQSAALPGEIFDANADETTPVQMKGLFAVEMTSSGIGTILIKRSEDAVTYYTVKSYTNTAAGDRRKYLYESFGDGTDSSAGAYYKAVMSGALTSGTFRVRFVK